jgi:hypothetical protein
MHTIGIVAAVALLGAHIAASQAPVDFTGRWVLEPPPAAPPPGSAPAPAGRPDQGTLARGDMGSGWGSPLTITQERGRLIVEPTVFSRYDANPQPRFVFALDGSDTRTTVMLGHATQIQTSRAEWAGRDLRIVTRYPGVDPDTGKPFSIEVTRRLILESPTSLVIEVTRAAALSGRETTTRAVYRKN